MGVGRFVYTPILPLMHAQAGLSAAAGANLATANYIGYLAGALLCIAVPAAMSMLRSALLVLVATLALMPAGESTLWWWTLRLIAGAASAIVFVIAVQALLHGLHGRRASLAGWGFGGIGAGIALSGAAMLVVRVIGDWRSAWFAAAALALALGAVGWTLSPGRSAAVPAPAAPADTRKAVPESHRRLQTILLISYSLEGLGYIVAGTFLVAAISQSSPGWMGTGAWVLVGLAAVPSAALWNRLGHRFTRPGSLTAALLLQSVGIALPALASGVGAALTSALLFGATFVAISQLALGTGSGLGSPKSVAVLTTGYSVGQILGPLLVTPALHHGYQQALLVAGGVVLASAVAATVLWAGLSPRAS